MPPARKPAKPPAKPTLDQRGEVAWKWSLRGLGMGGFVYVLVVMHGNVALGAWVIIGGLIGLPNALPLGQVVEAWRSGGGK